MIKENKLKNRIALLIKSIQKNNMDGLLILVEENRRYLSGFKGEDTQFDESAGALFISAEKLILATDSRFELQAKKEAPLYETICYKNGLASILPDIFRILKTKRLGFEGNRISYAQYNKMVEKLKSENLPVELVESNMIVENMRLVKEENEINALKRSLAIAESVFVKFLNTLKPGLTEKEAAWNLEKGMREEGADSLSFPTICASGPNSARPHAIPGNRKIQKGEPVLFDWGVSVDGYCSDISRTLIIGKPDDTFQKIFNTVLEAQLKAIAMIKSGISAKAVDAVAREHIDDMGFKGKFSHSLGHGIGLAVHENPRISQLSDTLLQPGMVFTVEPGIYISGWGGIRLENMVVVREKQVEVLNQTDPADRCLTV